MSKDPARFVVAACAANGFAFIIPNTSPFVIGGLVDAFPMSEAQAGLILTVELIAMGAAALLVSPFMRVIPQRSMALIGALLAAAANACVVFKVADGYTQLILFRVVAGIGTGLLLAVANAAIASSLSPERLYGVALMLGWFVAAALGPVMAKAAELAHYTGAYGVWMGLALLVVPLVLGLDQRPAKAQSKWVRGSSAVPGSVHLAGIALVGVAMMAYFAFVERMSLQVGFSLNQTGLLFAGISVAGALGAGLAGTQGGRFGLVWPLVVGTAVHAIAIVAAVGARNQWMFGVAASLEGISYMYLLTYQFGLAATLDHSGRWAAAAGGAMIGSTGFGPYIGGALITYFGSQALTWLVMITAALGAAAFLWVGSRLSKKTMPEPCPD